MSLLRRLAAYLLLLIAVSPVAHAFGVAGSRIFVHRELTLHLLPMAAVGVVLELWMGRRFNTFRVGEHETTHALIALLLGRRVRRFIVTRHRGGLVEHRGSAGPFRHIGDTLIGLAPYFLPTLAIVPLVARTFVAGYAWKLSLDLAIGLALGWHIASNARELRENFHSKHFSSAAGQRVQSDLGSRGLVYSVLAIVVLWLLVHGAILALLTDGWSGGKDWVRTIGSGFLREFDMLRALLKRV